MQQVSSNTDRDPDQGCFQCPVPPDQSAATLRCGCRQVAVTVAEASIDGFTVLVDAKLIGRLRFDRSWMLKHFDASFEVAPQWLYNEQNGAAQIGLRRMRDWSKPHRRSANSRFRRRFESGDDSNASLAFAGIALIVFVALALPGIGDSLGTAPRINSAITAFAKFVSSLVR